MSNLSRRRFLEDSMFAAAAAVVANQAPLAFAEETTGSKSPNERLSVAVIGVRGRGTSHIGAFAGKTDTAVTYICDADNKIGEQRCDEIEKKQGFRPKYVRDMRQVFEDKTVDIVSTATPNHWHALCAIWAMQAGKDVYVEKPVSHNVSEGRRIVEAARKYQRICQTGTQCRSAQGTIDAINYLKSGQLGEITLARGLCYKTRRSIGPKGTYEVPAEVDYNLWCGPAPMSPLTRKNLHYDWHWVHETGNGDLGNQGIHQVDVARWGLGVDALCDQVFSYGGRLGYEDAGTTANTQVCVFDYGSKKLVFEVRGLDTADYKGAKVGNVFYGKNGYLVLASYTGGAAFDLNGKKIAEFSGKEDHFANFLKGVRSRKHTDLNADILEGHLSSALCHLGNISLDLGTRVTVAEARERIKGDENKSTFTRFAEHLKDNNLDEKTELHFGRSLTLDPKSETFPTDSEANAKLTREYRAPFIVPQSV